MLGGIIISMAMSTGFLVFAWMLILLFEYVWSGMAKFIRVILFPGRLLHIASHYLTAKLLHIKAFEVLRTGFENERISAGIVFSSDIYRKKPYTVYAVALAPMPTALLSTIILRKILEILVSSEEIRVAIIVSWLIISIFVCGMPSLSDLQFIFIYHIIRYPEVIIALLWGIVVFILGYLAYGVDVAVFGGDQLAVNVYFHQSIGYSVGANDVMPPAIINYRPI